MKKLIHILPFMESNEIKELAMKIINKEVKGVKILLLYPFLSGKDLDEIVDLMLEKKMGKELSTAIPFLSKESLNKIYEGVQAGEITGINETTFLPFLGKEKLKEMFDKLVKEAEENAGNDEDIDLDIDHEYFDLDDDEEDE